MTKEQEEHLRNNGWYKAIENPFLWAHKRCSYDVHPEIAIECQKRWDEAAKEKGHSRIMNYLLRCIGKKSFSNLSKAKFSDS